MLLTTPLHRTSVMRHKRPVAPELKIPGIRWLSAKVVKTDSGVHHAVPLGILVPQEVLTILAPPTKWSHVLVRNAR